MILLSEHAQLPLIIIKYLIICKKNNNRLYVSRNSYVYFFSNVSDIFLIMFFKLYFIYLITRQNDGNSLLCQLTF